MRNSTYIEGDEYSPEQIQIAIELFYKYFIPLTTLYDLMRFKPMLKENTNVTCYSYDVALTFPRNILSSFCSIGSNQKYFLVDRDISRGGPVFAWDNICTPFQCFVNLMNLQDQWWDKNFNSVVNFYNEKFPSYQLKINLDKLYSDICSILPKQYYNFDTAEKLRSFVQQKIHTQGSPIISAREMICFEKFKSQYLNQDSSMVGFFKNFSLKSLITSGKLFTLIDLMPYIQNDQVKKVLNSMGLNNVDQLTGDENQQSNLWSLLTPHLPVVLTQLVIDYLPEVELELKFFR